MAIASGWVEEDYRPADPASGLAGRALPGWMDREQAVKFLTEDCLFSSPITPEIAEEIWRLRRKVVESLAPADAAPLPKLPLSDAENKAIQKFRKKYPDAGSVIDFVKLNPADLLIHQLWISTSIADRYRDAVKPEKWLQTALLDPPSDSRLQWRREENAIVVDLPHFEFLLEGPLSPAAHLRVAPAPGYITVSFHNGRALLMLGYHRTFACVRSALSAANAPRGVLFAVTNELESMGSKASDVLEMMESPRPPRMADLCDERLYLDVTLKRRRYQMRIQYEVSAVEEQMPLTAAAPFLSPPQPISVAADRKPSGPRDLQGILNKAARFYNAGRMAEAVEEYRRALVFRPNMAEAHNNLGYALAALGRLPEAIPRIERALALKPNFAEAHSNLGFALTVIGRIDEGMRHFEHALALKPDMAAAHNGLGIAFAAQARFYDAREHYTRAIEISPDYAEAHYNRAEINSFRESGPEMEALAALAERRDLPPRGKTYIHFALAGALDERREYSQAFEQMRQGNALKRGQIDYDETATRDLFQRVSSVFDSALLNRSLAEGDPSSVPIFIVGMPRSGSTLVEQILASHPQIHGAGELADLDIIGHNIPGDRGVLWPDRVPALDGQALRKLGQSYLERLPVVGKDTLRIVDKLPHNFLRIGLIRLILPNARIIHTMRDPLDTCLSCYSKLFLGQLDFAYDLEELGRYYRLYSQMMDHWRSVLPPGAMLEVSYEDLVNDLEGQSRRMIDYCGLAWDDRCLSFHLNQRPVNTASAVQVRQPLFRSSLQRWRHYEQWLGPLRDALGELATEIPTVRMTSGNGA